MNLFWRPTERPPHSHEFPIPLLGDRGIIICSIESPQKLWQDTFGATSEEKANGSGDVRTDLQEALATSVAVAPEPYDPPRLIRDAPINQDVKGGKGEKGEQEKGDRKGKGSNATGNVANDAVVAKVPLNLDVKGGKGEKEKGGGKGRAKGKGKKGGKDSAGKGDWDKGQGKGKAKGKGKKDSNGHGKGANGPEHQQVMPETQFNMDVPGGKGEWEKGYRKGWKGKGKKGSNGKGANDAGHQNFKGGKGYRNKGHGKGNAKGNAKGKGKKGGKDFQAKGGWDKGYGKGSPKGNGKKGGKDFHATGGWAGWDKGYGKGKGKKGLEQMWEASLKMPETSANVMWHVHSFTPPV